MIDKAELEKWAREDSFDFTQRSHYGLATVEECEQRRRAFRPCYEFAEALTWGVL